MKSRILFFFALAIFIFSISGPGYLMAQDQDWEDEGWEEEEGSEEEAGWEENGEDGYWEEGWEDGNEHTYRIDNNEAALISSETLLIFSDIIRSIVKNKDLGEALSNDRKIVEKSRDVNPDGSITRTVNVQTKDRKEAWEKEVEQDIQKARQKKEEERRRKREEEEN